MIVAAALVLALADPGVPRQAVPDPQRLDAAHPARQPAGAGQPHRHAFRLAASRRDHRVPSAQELRSGLRRPHPGENPTARTPHRRATSRRASRHRRRSSSARRASRVTASRIVNGHVIRNGVREHDPYTVACNGASACNLPTTISVPARRLLHDGRQSARLRGQPVLGPGPAHVDHRPGDSDLLASWPDRLSVGQSASGTSDDKGTQVRGQVDRGARASRSRSPSAWRS